MTPSQRRQAEAALRELQLALKGPGQQALKRAYSDQLRVTAELIQLGAGGNTPTLTLNWNAPSGQHWSLSGTPESLMLDSVVLTPASSAPASLNEDLRHWVVEADDVEFDVQAPEDVQPCGWAWAFDIGGRTRQDEELEDAALAWLRALTPEGVHPGQAAPSQAQLQAWLDDFPESLRSLRHWRELLGQLAGQENERFMYEVTDSFNASLASSDEALLQSSCELRRFDLWEACSPIDQVSEWRQARRALCDHLWGDPLLTRPHPTGTPAPQVSPPEACAALACDLHLMLSAAAESRGSWGYGEDEEPGAANDSLHVDAARDLRFWLNAALVLERRARPGLGRGERGEAPHPADGPLIALLDRLDPQGQADQSWSEPVLPSPIGTWDHLLYQHGTGRKYPRGVKAGRAPWHPWISHLQPKASPKASADQSTRHKTRTPRKGA